MKYSHFLVVGLTAFALTACGGGGDSSTPAANATPAATGTGTTDASGGTASTPVNPGMTPSGFDATEFLGEWRRTDAASCYSTFNYSAAYHFRNDKVTLTATELSVAETIYTDAACTNKAGILVEKYSITYTAGTAPGRTNVARTSLVYSGSNSSADGGSGLTFTKVPDGSQTGGSQKGLLDVDGSKLYTNSKGSVIDADGYPTALAADAIYTR